MNAIESLSYVSSSGEEYLLCADGLELELDKLEKDIFISNSNNTIRLEEGTLVGKLSFKPFESYKFNPEFRYRGFVKGLSGISTIFNDFAEASEQNHDLLLPEYFYAEVDVRLIRLATRLGFMIADQMEGENRYEIVGEIEVVKSNVEKVMHNPHLMKRLNSRADSEMKADVSN